MTSETTDYDKAKENVPEDLFNAIQTEGILYGKWQGMMVARAAVMDKASAAFVNGDSEKAAILRSAAICTAIEIEYAERAWRQYANTQD